MSAIGAESLLSLQVSSHMLLSVRSLPNCGSQNSNCTQHGQLQSCASKSSTTASFCLFLLQDQVHVDVKTAAVHSMETHSHLQCKTSKPASSCLFLLQDQVHPQTIAVCQSRAAGLSLTVEVVDAKNMNIDKDVSGVLLQYPATDGSVQNYKVSQT